MSILILFDFGENFPFVVICGNGAVQVDKDKLFGGDDIWVAQRVLNNIISI
jgi:hypothetical protein